MAKTKKFKRIKKQSLNNTGDQKMFGFLKDKTETKTESKPIVKSNPASNKYYCLHDGKKEILNINGLSVSGSKYHDLPDKGFDFLLNCYNKDQVIPLKLSENCPDHFNDLKKYVYGSNIKTLNIDWPDCDGPPVKPEFWYYLPELLMKNRKKGKLIVCCMGSHGRTGTALAALAILHNALSVQAAIKLIRDLHCHNSVEVKAQIEYLKTVEKWGKKNGINIPKDNSKMPEDVFHYDNFSLGYGNTSTNFGKYSKDSKNDTYSILNTKFNNKPLLTGQENKAETKTNTEKQSEFVFENLVCLNCSKCFKPVFNGDKFCCNQCEETYRYRLQDYI